MDELITRRFTSALNDPAYAGKTVYDLFEWSKRDVHLTDYKTGRVLCDMQGLEFPSSYSQNAVDIIASKYFRRAGVPVTGHEVSMRQGRPSHGRFLGCRVGGRGHGQGGRASRRSSTTSWFT